MSKSPAFQMYPNDFLGSGKVAGMSLSEIGAFTLLLCYDWNETGLPNDMKLLARWLRVTPRQFNSIWSKIKDSFELYQGRWYNPRLQKEREKQAEWRAKSSKGGHASAEARLKGGSPLVPRVVEGSRPALASPVSSPNGNTSFASTSASAVKAKKAPEKTEPFPKSICDALYETWTEVRGAIDYGAFRKALKPLYPTGGPRYSQDVLTEAIKAHAEYVEGLQPREAGFETIHKFAADVQRWVRIGGMPAVDPDTRELTERGRLALA